MPIKLEILDDEQDFCDYVCIVAESIGFRTRCFSNPQSFVDSYHQHSKEVVLLDLYMPGIDGVELLRFMAQENPPSALILMSGGDELVLKSAQKLATELELRVLDVIRKPIRKNQLVNILSKIPEKASVASIDHRADVTPSASALEEAVQQQQIDVVFQPQISCETGRICAIEALARWRHKEAGQVSPLVFIPMAESCGLIPQLDTQVMKKSVQFLAEFHLINPELRLSVNMSAHTFSDLALPEIITDQLKAQRILPDYLSIEVTESAVMEDLRRSLDILTRLRMKGVFLSIDDFGTGYSSMSQLVRIPFSELKVDRSFVKDINTDRECNAIVKASIMLARELGMKTVAEGVSSQDVLDQIQALNCDSAQGFFTGKPMPAEKIIGLLSEQQ